MNETEAISQLLFCLLCYTSSDLYLSSCNHTVCHGCLNTSNCPICYTIPTYKKIDTKLHNKLTSTPSKLIETTINTYNIQLSNALTLIVQLKSEVAKYKTLLIRSRNEILKYKKNYNKDYNKTKDNYNKIKDNYNDNKDYNKVNNKDYNKTKDNYNKIKDNYNDNKDYNKVNNKDYNKTKDNYNNNYNDINNKTKDYNINYNKDYNKDYSDNNNYNLYNNILHNNDYDNYKDYNIKTTNNKSFCNSCVETKRECKKNFNTSMYDSYLNKTKEEYLNKLCSKDKRDYSDGSIRKSIPFKRSNRFFKRK